MDQSLGTLGGEEGDLGNRADSRELAECSNLGVI